MAKSIEADVLIVGAGPAGAATAVFLAKHGVRSLVISRHRGTAHTPRAHITNQRTMEAMRDAGLEETLMLQASPGNYIEHAFWLRSMIGEEIARTHGWGNDPSRKSDYETASPCRVCDLPQTRLEPILVTEAARLGCQMRFSTELVGFEQDAASVVASLRDGLTGELLEVRAKYMVGADGARSSIVERLGLPLTGQHGLGDIFNVHCEVDLADMARYRRGSLYSIIQPGSALWAPVGVFRMVRPWSEWLVGLVVPSGSAGQNPTTEEFEERLRTLIGGAPRPLKILSTSMWTVNAVVAETYSKGRVFCMGDAVHRHPPTNGLGSNTSIQDAFNLAWKLALVLQSKAAPALLQTYDTERQPVGRKVVLRANNSANQNRKLWDLLGAGIHGEMPPQQHAPIFDTPEGRRELRKEISKMHYEYQALGVELNCNYESAAVVGDGTSSSAIAGDAELHYFPSTRPGSYLPHAWLGHRMPGPPLSTLDVAGKSRFMVLTGPGGEGWKRAAAAVSVATRVSIGAAAIGPFLDYEDLYGTWRELCGTEEDGCVLVRPDLIVGWRSANLVEDPQTALHAAMRQILALERVR